MTTLKNPFGDLERAKGPAAPVNPPDDADPHLAAQAPPSFTEHDVDVARAIGEDMVRIANESLAIANMSRDVATRVTRTRLTRVYLERTKRLSVQYPFLRLTMLDAFEENIRQVELETSGLQEGDLPLEQTKTARNSGQTRSIGLRITKVAELVSSEIVVSRKSKPQEFAKMLIDCEPCGFDGPNWCIAVTIGDGPSARNIKIDLSPLRSNEEWEFSRFEPVLIDMDNGRNVILFRDRFFLPDRKMLSQEDRAEARLRAKKLVYDEEGELTSLRAAVSNMEAAIEFQRTGPKREPIPDDVKMLVWSRDGASCARCGSAERLHFDHIIPVVKGGSNEAVNIQLLCQPCNLKKSDKIAF